MLRILRQHRAFSSQVVEALASSVKARYFCTILTCRAEASELKRLLLCRYLLAPNAQLNNTQLGGEIAS